MKKCYLLLCSLLLIVSGVLQSCKENEDTPTGPRTEIYVSDAGNFEKGPWQILKYNEDGSNPQVFINKNLAWPQDILFLEDQGIVLVTNGITGNIAKFKIDNGEFIGNFDTGLGLPNRMKIRDNLIYVLQWGGTEKVHRYKLDGTFVDEFTKVGVHQSIGLDWDADGNLYISSFDDGANGFVRKFDTEGNDMGLFIDKSLQGPTNIWFDKDGNLLVNDWQAGKIQKFDANGVFVKTVVTGVSQVEGVAFLEDGSILIGHGAGASIKMYDSNFKFIKDLVTSKSGGLIKPNAVTVRKVE